MNFILFEDATVNDLLPFTFMRALCDIRIGILTLREKWEKHLNTSVSILTRDYLQKKYPLNFNDKSDSILINSTICPDEDLIKLINALRPGEAISDEKSIIVLYPKAQQIVHDNNKINIDEKVWTTKPNITYNALRIEKTWDLFTKNEEAIKKDFQFLSKGKKSQKLSETNRAINPDAIFIEEGAKVEHAILNASTGPIYIGKAAEIMEGAMIRGPFALCEHATIKMGTKIYGATTVGPYSKVGGELSNSVIFGYSNKAHDGFLGNSVIGEWCNLGADTNNSNLKNNYSNVKVWSYASASFVDSGLQFCGLFLGDHSKTAINTMFNTGTVVGISANIFGAGFPDKYIPSFSWGGTGELKKYQLDKALETAKRAYERRNKLFDETEEGIFKRLYLL